MRTLNPTQGTECAANVLYCWLSFAKNLLEYYSPLHLSLYCLYYYVNINQLLFFTTTKCIQRLLFHTTTTSLISTCSIKAYLMPDSIYETMLRTAYRMSFLPSLSYNVVLNKLNVRPWYNRVDDRVIIGALPWISIKNELIENERVRGVVSMNENFELAWLKRWVASGDQWTVSNVDFLQLQTQDIFEAPAQEKLKAGVDFIMSSKLGDSVYVHCKAGRTRSAALVCCYLMKRNNWTPEQAYELLAAKRPQLALHSPQWQALREFYDNHVSNKSN